MYFVVLPILVNLSTLSEKSFRIYVDNFEKAYIESTESFYRIRIDEYIQKHGIRVSAKVKK